MPAKGMTTTAAAKRQADKVASDAKKEAKKQAERAKMRAEEAKVQANQEMEKAVQQALADANERHAQDIKALTAQFEALSAGQFNTVNCVTVGLLSFPIGATYKNSDFKPEDLRHCVVIDEDQSSTAAIMKQGKGIMVQPSGGGRRYAACADNLTPVSDDEVDKMSTTSALLANEINFFNKNGYVGEYDPENPDTWKPSGKYAVNTGKGFELLTFESWANSARVARKSAKFSGRASRIRVSTSTRQQIFGPQKDYAEWLKTQNTSEADSCAMGAASAVSGVLASPAPAPPTPPTADNNSTVSACMDTEL